MKQFVLDSIKQDDFDELPSAPGAEHSEQVAVETAGDADMFEGVGKLGETIPNGTYHFRLNQIVAKGATVPSEQGTKPPVPLRYSSGEEMDAQPWFMAEFVCQQEPHTGKRFAEFIGWASATLRKKAKEGDAMAKQQLKNRLVRIKAIMEAAGFKPAGSYDLERDFFATNPEVRIQVGQGKNKQSGEDQNRALKYFSLTRPN